MRHRAGLALLALVAGILLGAGPAQAETAYRYWSYWLVVDGGWAFAQEGPATRLPADGDAEAWTFGVSSAAGSPELAPEVAAADAFASLCAEVPAEPGRKRVAVLVDPGTGAEPPAAGGACVVIDGDATSAQALGEAFEVRAENGLVCGINGYPATGCAEVVDTSAMAPEPAPAPQPTGTGLGLSGPVATALVAAVLAVVGFVLWRRRR